MNVDRFYERLEIVTRRYEGHLERNDTQIIFDFGSHTYTEDISNIERIIDNVSAMNKSDNAIYNDTTYEIALDRRTDIIRFLDRYDLGIIEDCENKIKYKIDIASDDYFIWFLFSLDDRELRKIRDFSIPRTYWRYRNDGQDDEKKSLLEFLRRNLRSLLTLKIQCVSMKTKVQFEQIFDSFRFQLANSFNDVVMPLNDLRDLCMPMVGRRITTSTSEFTAPKRVYVTELTNQYYMGLSSKLPFVQFISYYHVMEYYFEKVYNDDMIKNLQDKISSPRFSIKREQDIKEIVRFVTKKVHDKNERYDINELEALELVLRKYIDISELLNNIPNMAIDYYKTYEVPFSKGDIVDFNDITNPKLYRKIAARIYKTRNSIIHSKSGEKAVYSPFKDDEALEKEIPLLRYVAEEIIIKTSKLM